MKLAEMMIANTPLPKGATLLGYIDKHPAEAFGLGYAVLRMRAGEVAWDGERIRTLSADWRELVDFTAKD